MDRFLSKIVVINSAVFDLAEIDMDGHTCIIGANNRGKTTLLRTIAFFYNPSNRKSELGIKSVESDFSKFYFHDNYPSYLIYEVSTNRGPFHVVFYKSNGFINYRFVNGGYSRELYFDTQNKLMPILIEEVLAKLNQQGIWYSNEMDKWNEYRDVLYGKFRASRKSTQKNLEQLYLFRGETQSENIPKIIRDIFLNSNPRFAKELKSDFVKAFITNAVSDKAKNRQGVTTEYAIDLLDLSVQLGDYLDHFEDIKAFQKTSQDRGIIKDKFESIKSLKQTQKELALQLGSAVKYAQSQLKALENQQSACEAELKGQKEQLSDFLQKKDQEQTGFNEKMGSLKEKIRLGEAAKKLWDTESFQKGYQQYLQKDAFESQLKQEKQEKQILQAAFQDVHVKYEQRFANLENEKNAFLTDWKGRKDRVDHQHIKLINELTAKERSEVDLVRQKYSEQQEKLHKELSALAIALVKLESQAELIQREDQFEQEIKQLEKELSQIRLAQNERKYQLANQEDAIKTWRNQLIPSLEEKCAKSIAKREEHDQQRIDQLNKEIEGIQHRIKVSPDSFYGYLNKNVPNWTEHIGKVCDESVLFNTTLSPKKAAELVNTFYGIELDLDQLTVIAKSLEEYEQDVESRKQEIRQIQQDLQQFQQAQWDKRDREIDVLRKKINDTSRNVEQLKHEQNLAIRKLAEIDQSIANFRSESVAQMEQKTKENQAQQQTNKNQAEELNKQVAVYADAQQEEIEKITNLYEVKRTTLKQQKSEELIKLSTEKEQQETSWLAKKTQIEEERKADLEGKVDLDVLKQLEQTIDTLEKSLEAINEFRKQSWDGGGNYEHFIQHHKPNSIDRLPELLLHRKAIEEQLLDIQKQKYAYQTEYEKHTEDLRKKITSIEKQLDQYKGGIAKYHKFQHESRLWLQHKSIIENAPESSTENSIDVIYMQLIGSGQKLTEAYTIFRQMTLKLIQQFRPSNSLGLKLIDETKDSSYDRFAEKLKDIQEQKTIESAERETIKQKIQLVDVIYRQITTLKSQLGKVRKAVNSISNDIATSGFTDAKLIVSFEMKVEETNNRVMLQLEKIANLKEENGQAFNELAFMGNLVGHELDKKSTTMLEHLKNAIDDSRFEALRLQDMFELAFSYDDKRNKKTNVTNIDDIGSEGTTVLIKSCIYISLLNFFAKQGKIFNQQTYLHCIIDEVGKISEPYLKTLLDFALERQIYLLNALPNKSKLETYYNYTYKLREVTNGDQFIAKVDRLLSKKISLKDHVPQD